METGNFMHEHAHGRVANNYVRSSPPARGLLHFRMSSEHAIWWQDEEATLGELACKMIQSVPGD